MARDTKLTQQRNNSIRNRFRFHRKKNPKWTIIAVIEEVSIEFYLTPGTVTKILKDADHDVPSVNTVLKYTVQNLIT